MLVLSFASCIQDISRKRIRSGKYPVNLYDKTIMISKKTPFLCVPYIFFSHKEKDEAFFACPTVLFTPQKNEFFPLIDPTPIFLLKAATASELPSFLTASISAFPLPFFRYASPTKRPSIELFIRSMKPRMIPASLAAIICASGKGLLTQVKLSSK